jgi:hypothetical protein
MRLLFAAIAVFVVSGPMGGIKAGAIVFRGRVLFSVFSAWPFMLWEVPLDVKGT